MRKAPYIFVVILSLVLFFLVGFRMGQKTEKTNKTIDFIISITPYPTYTPYPSPIKTATASPTLKPTRTIPTFPVVIPSIVEESKP